MKTWLITDNISESLEDETLREKKQDILKNWGQKDRNGVRQIKTREIGKQEKNYQENERKVIRPS